MLLNRFSLMARLAASRDESRFNINVLRVESDGRTVATDGHRLYTVTPPPDADDAEYPDVGDVPATLDPLADFSMPRDVAERIAKALPKKPRLAILGSARLDVAATNADGKVRVVVTDLDTVTPIEARKVDGDFPDWRQVLPEGDPVASFTVNGRYLADVAKAAADFSGTRGCAVRVECFGELSPIRFTAENPETGQTFVGVVMPMRA